MVCVTKARRVLKDARYASKLFKKGPIDTEFRLAVVLNLTLIRAVGNVIEDENSGTEKIKSDTYFNAYIKNEKIYKHFIAKFRNNLLKEYSSNSGWLITTKLNGKSNISYPILDGEYKGRDLRDLIKDAIKFWRLHLKNLEKL